MKKLLLIFCVLLVTVQSQAQLLWYGNPFWYAVNRNTSTSTANAAIAGGTVLGVASIVGSTIIRNQEIKAQKEAQERYDKEKVVQKGLFPAEITKADSLYNAGNYSLALQAYAGLAHNNDNYNEDLGDQLHLINRIKDCNEKVGTVDENPGPINNLKARKTDYSEYTSDIESPVYIAKKKANFAQITRVSCNDKETRVEFEYQNTFNGEIGLGVNGKTYIKGKKSGKLQLRRLENITIAPAKTLVPYGRQTLKFTLIFPALDPRDDKFDFVEPKSDWKFDDIVCK